MNDSAPLLSRRALLGAGGAVGLGLVAGAPMLAPARARAGIAAAYTRAFDDVAARFWDAEGAPESGGLPRIRPTHRLDGPRAGLPDVPRMKGADAWQTWVYLNQLYWNWKVTGDPAVRAMIAAQGRSLLATDRAGRPYAYTAAELASDGAADDTIHLQDDAAVKIQAMAQIHDATGDPRYGRALIAMIPPILRRFADRNRPVEPVLVHGRPARVNGVPLTHSPHGLAYGLDGDLARTTTFWEVTIALGALAAHALDGAPGWVAYARQVYARTWAEGRHSDGNLWSGVDLRTLTSPQAYFGYPKVGASSISIGGTMAMCILAARLARLPGTPAAGRARYRADITALIAAMLRPQERFGFVTSVMPVNGVFLPWEDSWTAFYHAVPFAREALSIPGVDPGGRCAVVLGATGRAALATRTAAGLYTIDWAGPLPKPADYGILPGAVGYEDFYRKNPGSTYNSIAGSPQVMTNAQALSAGLAALVVERQG